MRVHADCVPGRPGCVLRANSRFLVPVDERLRQRKTGIDPMPGNAGQQGEPGGS